MIIHNCDEAGYWPEGPSIPGCVTQGESYQELISNLYEAIEGCLSVDVDDYSLESGSKVMELAV